MAIPEGSQFVPEKLENKISEIHTNIDPNFKEATPLAQTLVSMPSVPTSSSFTPSVTSVASENKPKILGAISGMIFIIASIYVFSTISLLAIVLILGKITGSGDTFSFLKYFPLFGIVPILFSFAAFAFYFVAIKVRDGSRLSFWLGIASLVGIPILAGYTSQLSMSSFLNQVRGFSQAGSSIGSIASGQTRLRFDDPIFILAIISIVLMVLSYKKFTFKTSSISKKSRIFLLFVIVLLIIPVVVAISLDYRKAFETDYGYAAATRVVKYHVYRPRTVPTGLTYVSKVVVGQKLGGKHNAVQVAFDIPFDEMLRNKPIRLTVLRQVGVEGGFDIENFASTYMQASIPQKISLAKATNQTAYHLEKAMKNSTLHALVYLTSDNVLITIISPKSTLDQLVEVANSLE